jgi:hypothetical protein
VQCVIWCSRCCAFVEKKCKFWIEECDITYFWHNECCGFFLFSSIVYFGVGDCVLFSIAVLWVLQRVWVRVYFHVCSVMALGW